MRKVLPGGNVECLGFMISVSGLLPFRTPIIAPVNYGRPFPFPVPQLLHPSSLVISIFALKNAF